MPIGSSHGTRPPLATLIGGTSTSPLPTTGSRFSGGITGGRRAGRPEFAYCELLLSGVTSLVDISPAWDGWIELFARSGMRGFIAPGFASARWRLGNEFEAKFAWDQS